MRVFIITSVAAFIFVSFNSQNLIGDTYSSIVDDKGNITRPTDFKEKWVYLGSWIHPDSLKDGFHNVYTQPGVVEKYKKSGGEFPDGAVLVKELRSSSTADMTTGKNVHSADKEVLWFVMVKDKKGRFADNPKWGDGWGWALYYADNPSKDVSTDYKKDCLGCHIPAKGTDWIYVNGYPVLK
ncbi:MAG TPA: cytochrome P460 family protein [Thermodesulfobacteriota bacterium]|nr:cytochrome P460 family protein [Thermodesulfobacteriota bacterium]